MAEVGEEQGTRYEIHVQNEDGTSNVIVIYNNDNEPAQVQDLVSKALAELAKETQDQSIIIADEGDGAILQAEVYNDSALLTTDSLVTGMDEDIVKIELETPQPMSTMLPKMGEQVLRVEIEAPDSSFTKQEVYTALKPEELEQMGMVQVENEFTAKTQPYKLQSVEPEELLGIEEDLNMKKKLYGRRYHMINDDNVDRDRIKAEDNNQSQMETEPVLQTAGNNIEENEAVKVDVQEEVKLFVCRYENCDFEIEGEIPYQRHLKTVHEEESPFKCCFCTKEFKFELSLKIHLLRHQEIPALSWDMGPKERKQYTCFVCQEFKCLYKRLLLQHLKDEHDVLEAFTCQKCKEVFSSMEDLQVHFGSATHEENQWTNCKICGAASKNLSQHMKRMHSDDKPYKCEECNYSCKFSGALKAHMLIHSSDRAFKCELCDYSARSKDQLKRHEVVHSTVKDHKCPHCSYATQTIYRLKKHMKIHTNTSKGYKCILCEFTTHDKILLQQHKKEFHSRKLNLECKQCDLKFNTVQEVKVHNLSVHKCENSWFCKYCDFSCATRRELGQHMQVHVGKHRYVCKICGYSCRQSNPFKRHLARHNKVKAFQCAMCEYSCTDKYDLEKHIITHSDAKTVNCPDCTYTCRYKAQLVRHKKLVHDEAKPYFCTYCTYTTKSPQNLKNHMHLHAEKKPHQCVLCDFSACQKSNLKRHMQTHMKKAQIVYV